MKKNSVLGDLFGMIAKKKAWWIIPIIILLIIAAIIVVIGSSPLAPLIYPLI